LENKENTMSTANWKRIMATTDFSPFGNKAVAYAHDLAENCGAELHVLTVADNADVAARQGGATGVLEPADKDDERWAWLAELHGETGKVRRIDAVVIGKKTAEKIAEYAQKHEIDLIVIASHGRTGIKHAVLGSVTEKVIRSAHCPVLVLRPSAAETAKAAK
jgi:nucleotide-binding universal stress UspA family protein